MKRKLAVCIAFASIGFSMAAKAQTVTWSKSLADSLATNTGYSPYTVSYSTATSGSTSGPTVSGVNLGIGDTAISPQHYYALGPGNYVELTLTFDHMLSGGTLSGIGSLQNDTTITLVGGTATLSNIDTSFTQYMTSTGTSAPSSLGTMTGSGTASMTMTNDSIPSNDWQYSWRGSQGLQITGTWNKVVLRQYSDASNPVDTYTNGSYDNIAGFTVSGATVVPEAGSAAAVCMACVVFLGRHRRSSRIGG